MRTLKDLMKSATAKRLSEVGQTMRPVKVRQDGHCEELSVPTLRVKWDRESRCLICSEKDAIIAANMLGEHASIDGEIVLISRVEIEAPGILKVFVTGSPLHLWKSV